MKYFANKELHLNGPNIIIFQLVKGPRQWHVLRCCIAPSNASIIEDVAAAIMARPYGAELLVTGDLNANIVEPEGTPRGEAIADGLAATGLVYMGLRFLSRRKPWLQDRCMWNMRRDI